MKYITHHRFKGISLCGEQLNIPYGTEIETVGYSIIMPNSKVVCYWTSENAKRHFARNNDGRGLERGKLTYAIAYRQRERQGASGQRQRFTDDEIKILKRDWVHFLRQDVDTVLFNNDFFAADVDELQRLADALHIKIKRR